MATPSGTMKVTEAKFRAIWWAATELAPNVPMTRVMALNSMASKIMVIPMGMPRRRISASLAATGRPNRRKMR